MADTLMTVPLPENEPVQSYAPGSAEKKILKTALAELAAQEIEIPLLIGGREVYTGRLARCRMPHAHGHVLAVYHQAGPREVRLAIQAAQKAKLAWSAMDWQHRAAILLKAAELLAGPWRATVNAATMLGQSKTPLQAELDAACELIDFWRFNPWFYEKIMGDQPLRSQEGRWNYMEHRPLDGFVFAASPFNFTSIASNLPTAPALCGNTVIWKPASGGVYANYFVMKVLQAAGLPEGVINFVPGPGAAIGDCVLASPHLGGVHFTGSTRVFQNLWQTIGQNISRYGCYPRIVGETGGKGFIVAHASADEDALVAALVRGAFEYQGQKCSAASRVYIPASRWQAIRRKLLAELATITVGDVADFRTFMGAVIDRGAYERIKGTIERARKDRGKARIIAGGRCDDSEGYFIEPTVILCSDPYHTTMVEEIFGPVMSVYVYQERDLARTLKLIDQSSPYALTGAVFAQDRTAIMQIKDALKNAAGNFYINDKPTGAVVGQQPFGGSRASGTNDKAGSCLNLVRWVSPRTVKETFNPQRDYRYPHLREK